MVMSIARRFGRAKSGRAFAVGVFAACTAWETVAQAQVSPWPRSHRTPGQQATTPLPGPDADASVQVSLFTEDIGKAIGTSPFMVLSGKRYPARPTARTIWGATLTDIYKYEIDGEAFAFADRFRANALSVSVGWNLFALPGDRIVVPNPTGLRLPRYRGTPCFGTAPSLMVFKDGLTPDSDIRCVSAFSFTKRAVEAACGFRRMGVGTTAVITGELPDGHVAVALSKVEGRGASKRVTGHLAVLDPSLSRIVACEAVGQGSPTNQFPVERAADGASLAYLAVDDAVVRMRFDTSDGSLRRDGVAEVAFRGRTGTTPTLMDVDGRKLLLLVDARCAVTKVFTGAIECTDGMPSCLLAFDRDDLSASPAVTELPDVIDTVENSPSVSGGEVVVANYSGYSFDGSKDGKRDIAKGVAKLRWTGAGFVTIWLREDIQISGIPTISIASGMVYSSGAEADGVTYVYGLDFATGATRLRVAAGPAVSTSRRRKDGVFDAGNGFVINDDGSGIFPAGETLVRVR